MNVLDQLIESGTAHSEARRSERRSTNPKGDIGSLKLPLHLWPAEATAVGCLGLLEGESKYGRSNFLAGDGVIASIYVDATKRHLEEWMAGQDFDPISGKPTLAGALASLAIIVKAQAHGKLIDDRDFSGSPNAYSRLVESLTPLVGKIKKLFLDRSPKHYTIADNPTEPRNDTYPN